MNIQAEVEAHDSTFAQIVPEKVMLEQIAGGLNFTEGPLWYKDSLIFSDIPRNRIARWRMLSEGPEITTFRSPSGNSNGLTLDRSGRLIACESSTRRVTRTEIDGTIQVLAERYEGKRLNGPNDVVARTDGCVYFTDPSFGTGERTGKELTFNGVYCIKNDGKLLLLTDDFTMPNGLALSPDETILYVNDTRQRSIRAFDVNPDGSVSNNRVLIEMQGTEPGSPDGMKVDQQGNIYCTGPGGIWIINSSGKYLGRILMSEMPSNFAWGDTDWKTLYITARTSIYRIKLLVPGKPVP